MLGDRLRIRHGEPEDGARPPSLVLPVAIWALVIVASIATLVLVSGCTTIEGVCAVQPIGQDEAGVAYFRYHCEPR